MPILIAIQMDSLLGIFIAITGAMVILGISMFVARKLGKRIDAKLQERKEAKGELVEQEEKPEADKRD